MLSKFDTLRKIAFISFFSSLYFYLPILTLYYQQRGLNFVQINSLWGIITGTIFFAEVPTGLIADRIGRKTSIILSLLCQLSGEIFFLFAQTYVHFIMISIISGIGFAFQSGCTQALMYESLKEKRAQDKMKEATGITGAFFQSGHILGAFACSFIITQLTSASISLAIILTIVSVAVALCISFFLKEPKEAYQHTETHPLKTISASITLLRGNTNLQRIVLLGLFTTPFLGYLYTLQPPYFQQSHLPTAWLGLSLTIGGLIAIAVSKYAYLFEKVLGVEKGMFIATTAPGILYICMALFFSPVVAVGLFILNFSSMSLQDPLLADYYNRHIPSNIRATTLSTINMFSSVYITLIGLLIGWLADRSVSYAFFLMGILVLCGALMFRINESHVKVRGKYI